MIRTRTGLYVLALASIAGAWLGFANPFFHFPAAVLAFPAGLALLGQGAVSLKNAMWRGFWVSTLAYTGVL